VLGYAYAGPFRPRLAYRHTLEDSVYVAAEAHRRGIGRSLLHALITRATEAGFRQMIAVIGDSDQAASIGLHAALGFRMIGTLEAVGYKFGRWLDTVYMQRALGPGREMPPAERG
jgi:phosphinothricin acetyltransferase